MIVTTLAPSPIVAQLIRSIGRGKGRGTGTTTQGRTSRSGSGTQSTSDHGQAKVYALTPQDAHTSNVVITSILPICSIDACVFYDPGAMHSFVSSYFASRIGIKRSKREQDLVVTTPLMEVFVVRHEYRDRVV